MSSPPPSFRDSSPAGAPGRQRSKFTYRNLAQLASFSTSCPLRVVAHIDLDAFYAQCEMRRLDIADDQPLVVQQWYVTCHAHEFEPEHTTKNITGKALSRSTIQPGTKVLRVSPISMRQRSSARISSVSMSLHGVKVRRIGSIVTIRW